MHGALNRHLKKSTDSGAVRFVCAFFFSTTLLLTFTSAALAQESNPLLGTWRLNLSKSSFLSGPPTYKTVTCKIVPWQDGVRVIYDMVGWRGGVTHWEWTGRLDGQDYPLAGVDEVITNAYRRIDSRTYGIVAKLDGRVTTNTQIVISSDGAAMTATTPVSNPQGQTVTNTAVYEKR